MTAKQDQDFSHSDAAAQRRQDNESYTLLFLRRVAVPP
jgi:hypothetical protein